MSNNIDKKKHIDKKKQLSNLEMNFEKKSCLSGQQSEAIADAIRTDSIASTQKSHDSSQSINNRSINIKTSYVALFTLVSRILGFVRIGVISALFGAGGTADILNLVLSIPNNLRKLLAEGALYNAYMPSYAKTVGSSTRATKSSVHLFYELFFTIGFITLLLVVLMSIFSHTITNILFDFPNLESEMLAKKLFSYLVFFLFFITLSSMLSGILQTHKLFFYTALSPVLMSIGTILCTIIFYKIFHIYAVAYGYLVGGVLQFFWLCIPVYVTLHYKFSIKNFVRQAKQHKFLSQDFVDVFKRFPPIFLTVVFPLIGQQIAFYLASTLSEGSSSAFAYAIVFWQLPIGVIINSIVSVTYAYLLTLIFSDKTKKITSCIENAIMNLFMLILPVSIMFYFFAHAGVAVALQRGNLNAENSIIIAKILQVFSIGMFPYGLYLLLQKTLLAYQKNTSVFIYSVVFAVIDVILSYVLIRTKIQVVGLSLAYTLSLMLVVPIMYIHVKKYTCVNIKIIKYLKMMLGLLPLFLVSWGLAIFTQRYWWEGSSIINIVRFSLVSIFLIIIMFVGYRVIGINIMSIIRNIKRKEK